MRERNIFRLVFSCAIIAQIVLVSLFLLFPGWFLPSELGSHDARPTNAILDADGRLLYEQNAPSGALQYVVSLEEIPVALRAAVIATEDTTFYRNPGFDLMAMLRATWSNLRAGRVVAGASTITQQVIRQYMPASERYQQSLQRKLREVALAYALTRSQPKDEILSLYLNNTYFGHQAYGVSAAARIYLNKPVSQLDLAECALLAGLPQSPVEYDPLNDQGAAQARQKQVLRLMVQHGRISQAEAELAAREPLQFNSNPGVFAAPHFSVMVYQAMQQVLDPQTIERGGLRVYTTLNLDLQQASEEQLARQIELLNKPSADEPSHNVHNGAVLVLDPASGAIQALVGSPDYASQADSGAYNGVLALRQPGSALKPITYAAAFIQGLTPATMLADVPASYLTTEGEVYTPNNYDRLFHGPVQLRQALACSYNTIAVKILDQIGIGAFTALARQLGITTLDDASRYGLALTLGGVEVSLMELTAAYGAFANGGNLVTPYLIERIVTADGDLLYQAQPAPAQRVLDERIAYLITSILSDPLARAPAFGTSSVLELPFPAAVKTGTTGEWRDNWTIGYTSRVVVGVWIGNADNQPMVDVSGVTGAAPLWNAVMRSAHTSDPPDVTPPAGLKQVTVCALSGLLPTEACPHTRSEWFLEENVPRAYCTLHQLQDEAGRIISAGQSSTGSLHSIIIWPAELVSWAREQGLEVVDQSASLLALGTPRAQTLQIISPADGAVFTLNPALPAESQRIEIQALASRGFTQAQLYIDDTLVFTWDKPPFSMSWPLNKGRHLLYIEGIGDDGLSQRSAVVAFTVASPPVRRSD
ncbi:MAG: penicillin-binding protein 1C [Chloroflexi bacterium]|nr:penicillin-binding protein 1C [Chloroflexota bacterium]